METRTVTFITLRFAQVYRFLADAFLYPRDNWLEDLPLLCRILDDLNIPGFDAEDWNWDLSSLQAEHRRVFGLTGSLCYETEYGLPHEFRQSQELADIAGFYRAFGFQIGGVIRERPDHLAVELEFMYLLCVKEAYARMDGSPEQVEISVDAQRKFLQDHLGNWVKLVADVVTRSANEESAAHQLAFPHKGPYEPLARFAEVFIHLHATRLGLQLASRKLAEVLPTPLGPEISCGDCPLAE